MAEQYVIIDGNLVLYNEDEMTFLNIESDQYGRDVITFMYNDKEYSSIIVVK